MKAFIEKTFEEQVKDLQALVAIPSVSRGEPEENKPYGERVDAAWRKAAEIAKKLGFEKVFDVDHRCGVIEYGEGEELVAVMAHLDVVPEGKGWTTDPYGGEIKDGRMYGRGTVDDKGAAVNALYALAAIKDSGLKMKRRVRILLGLDEECGSTGMEHYREVEGEPTMAFTPDAVYPVVNSEMGILHVKYRNPLACTVKAKVGSVINVIPGEAEAELPAAAKTCLVPEGLNVTLDEKSLCIKGHGGHASMPWLAKNALQGLFFALAQQDIPDAERVMFASLAGTLKQDEHGEGMGLDREDESGRITVAPTLFSCGPEGVELNFDCRYPFSYTYEELQGKFDQIMNALGFTCTESKNTNGHFIPADSELVKGLMEVFCEVTANTDAKPLSMGGGTYAKTFKNAVAFGTVLPGDTDRCHLPDESVSLEEMKLNTLIMAEAIKKLAC